MNDVEGTDMARQLRRWGPLAALAVIAIVVVIVLVSSGGDDEGDTAGDNAQVGANDDPVVDDTADDTGADDTGVDDTGADDTATDDLADPDPFGDGEEVISWPEADEMGTTGDIDWGDRCDTELGRLAYPNFFAGACYAPFTGDNGGETYPGVTDDTIRIVWYANPANDPVVDFITSAVSNDDTPDQVFETVQNLTEFYGSYFETYGRTVELIRYDATGSSSDEVAARADAETIARDIRPLMVWNAPTLVSLAFGETLAANGVMCMCGGGETARNNQPYLHFISKSAEQSRILLAEYIGRRLAGLNAVHSGDFVDQERVFGYLYLETSDQSTSVAEGFRDRLRDEWDVDLAELVPYELDPGTLQEQAATRIARLKEAGVTSIIFAGDAVAPTDLTNEATAQEYFPEWILAGTVLVDTNAFARTYDQEQWQHAFGMSNSAAPLAREKEGFFFLHEWFTGEVPPAIDTIGVLFQPSLFFPVIQGVGPDLSPQNYMDGLLGSEPTARGALTQPSISWGDKDGLWPDEVVPDLNGIDDVSEIWWDPEQVGLDELSREGAGMYWYVGGGTRYLPGEWPDTEPDVFNPDNAEFFYDEPPPSEAPPPYPSPAAGG